MATGVIVNQLEALNGTAPAPEELPKGDIAQRIAVLNGLMPKEDLKPSNGEICKQLDIYIENGGGDTPTGTITITENGTGIDVAQYAEADVAVPQPSGTVSITANGTGIDIAQYAEADVAVPGLVPTGTKSITANGTNIDVAQYEYADVAVPQPSGTISISANGTDIDVAQYAKADVAVPGLVPTGTKNITANGTSIDVSAYAYADVAVPTGDTTNEDNLVSRPSTFTSYSNPRVTTIGRSAFSGARTLESVSFANATKLDTGAFSGAVYLRSFSLPKVNQIEDSAFNQVGAQCSAAQLAGSIIELESVTFLNRSNIFYDCSIETISLPNITSISGSPFACWKGKYFSAPKVTTAAGSTFYASSTAYKKLVSIDAPKLAGIPTMFARYQSNLTTVAPMRDLNGKISSSAFEGCASLTSLEFAGTCTGIEAYALSYCTNLTELVFDFDAVPPLANVNAFQNSTNLASIWVPDALLTDWQGETNWATMSTIIKPLSQRPSA